MGKTQQAGQPGQRLAGVCVTVVDNNPLVRHVVETVLTHAGCRVNTAADGFSALGVIFERKPEVVVLDALLPRLDGFNTCAVIKSNPLFTDTAVVLLSSRVSLFDQARGRVAGAQAHVTKPFTDEELITAIEDALRAIRELKAGARVAS